MKIEILYFDGCPTYLKVEKTLREVIAEEGMDAEIKLVAINTDEESQGVRFAGSPTIRVDGEDLFPVPERAEYALGCRMYATPEGLRGRQRSRCFRRGLGRRRAEVPKEVFRDSVIGLLQEGAQLVDVLPREEDEETHLRGAINMPENGLDCKPTASLDRAVPVTVYCHDYL